MKLHEFFSKFANLPLDRRLIVLDRIKYGNLTFYELYRQMKKLEEKFRPLRMERDNLLKIAEEFLHPKDIK